MQVPNPLAIMFLSKTSFYVSVLPSNILSFTLKYLICLTLSFPSTISMWPSLHNLLVFTTLLIHTLNLNSPSLLLFLYDHLSKLHYTYSNILPPHHAHFSILQFLEITFFSPFKSWNFSSPFTFHYGNVFSIQISLIFKPHNHNLTITYTGLNPSTFTLLV